MKMKKVYIILIVLALGAGVLLFLNSKTQNKMQQAKMEKYEVKLPEGFPKDFPLDKTVSPSTAQKQSSDTLEFKTNLLPAQAFVIYSEYFTAQKWKILIKQQNPLVSSINAKSPNGDIISVVIKLGNDQKSEVTAILSKKK